MPLTTMLHQCEIDQPTGIDELDELLAEARHATGSNYQIVMRPVCKSKRFGLFTRTVAAGVRPQLYVEVAGVFPWQVMGCAHDEPTVFAYLYGLINGAADNKEQR